MQKTLFQIWMDKLRRGNAPTEFQFWNPLRAKIGSTITLDVADLRDIFFKVDGILVYTRSIQGKNYTFTDYELLTENVLEKYRLRYMPRNEQGPTGEMVRTILLTMDEDHEYDAD